MSQPATSVAVVVLGMHRSGTSALTGLLGLLGVELGSNLHPANEFNQAGYFEHLDLLDVHERVFRALGSSWDDPRPLPLGWPQVPAVQELQQEILGIVQRDFAGKAAWAVKDPRLCRLWPLWEEVLARIGVAPRFLIIMRHPDEVADSLARRNGMPAWKAGLLYLDHSLQAEQATRSRPRLFTTYDRLIEDGPGVAQRIAYALGLGSIPNPFAGAAASFLDPSLRHHQAPPSRDRSHPWALRLYEAAAADAEPSEVFAAVGESFAAARDLLGPWLEEEAASRRQALEATAILAADIEIARRSFAERDRLEKHLTDRLEAGELALRERERELGVAQAEVGHLREALRARERELGVAQAEVGHLREALRRLEAQKRHAESQLDTEVWRSRHRVTAMEQSTMRLAVAEARLRSLTEKPWTGVLLRGLGLGAVLGELPSPGPLRLRVDEARLVGSACLVSGWCLATEGPSVRRLRLRNGWRLCEGDSNLPRPDVAAFFPGIEGAGQSGFRFELALPLPSRELLFEAERGDDAWEPAGRYVVTIDGAVSGLLASIDLPHGEVPSGTVRFSGWCLHPEQRIERLTLSFGSLTAECRLGLERADVASHFPQFAHAESSGFEVECHLDPGRDRVVLTACLEGGLVETYCTPLLLSVRTAQSESQPLAPAGSGPGVAGF